MRAKLTIPNGCYVEMKTPSEVKRRIKNTAQMATRLEILGLCESCEYMTLYGEYRFLNWYVNQKPNIRKLTVLNYWMYGTIPEPNEVLTSDDFRYGCEIALDWLMTHNPSGLIADTLMVQQSF